MAIKYSEFESLFSQITENMDINQIKSFLDSKKGLLDNTFVDEKYDSFLNEGHLIRNRLLVSVHKSELINENQRNILSYVIDNNLYESFWDNEDFFLNNLNEGIMDYMKQAKDWVSKTAKGVGSTISKGVEKTVDWTKQAYKTIKENLSGLLNWFKSLLKDLIGKPLGLNESKNINEGIGEFFSNAAKSFSSNIYKGLYDNWFFKIVLLLTITGDKETDLAPYIKLDSLLNPINWWKKLFNSTSNVKEGLNDNSVNFTYFEYVTIENIIESIESKNTEFRFLFSENSYILNETGDETNTTVPKETETGFIAFCMSVLKGIGESMKTLLEFIGILLGFELVSGQDGAEMAGRFIEKIRSLGDKTSDMLLKYLQIPNPKGAISVLWNSSLVFLPVVIFLCFLWKKARGLAFIGILTGILTFILGALTGSTTFTKLGTVSLILGPIFALMKTVIPPILSRLAGGLGNFGAGIQLTIEKFVVNPIELFKVFQTIYSATGLVSFLLSLLSVVAVWIVILSLFVYFIIRPIYLIINSTFYKESGSSKDTGKEKTTEPSYSPQQESIKVAQKELTKIKKDNDDHIKTVKENFKNLTDDGKRSIEQGLSAKKIEQVATQKGFSSDPLSNIEF